MAFGLRLYPSYDATMLQMWGGIATRLFGVHSKIKLVNVTAEPVSGVKAWP